MLQLNKPHWTQFSLAWVWLTCKRATTTTKQCMKGFWPFGIIKAVHTYQPTRTDNVLSICSSGNGSITTSALGGRPRRSLDLKRNTASQTLRPFQQPTRPRPEPQPSRTSSPTASGHSRGPHGKQPGAQHRQPRQGSHRQPEKSRMPAARSRSAVAGQAGQTQVQPTWGQQPSGGLPDLLFKLDADPAGQVFGLASPPGGQAGPSAQQTAVQSGWQPSGNQPVSVHPAVAPFGAQGASLQAGASDDFKHRREYQEQHRRRQQDPTPAALAKLQEKVSSSPSTAPTLRRSDLTPEMQRDFHARMGQPNACETSQSPGRNIITGSSNASAAAEKARQREYASQGGSKRVSSEAASAPAEPASPLAAPHSPAPAGLMNKEAFRSSPQQPESDRHASADHQGHPGEAAEASGSRAASLQSPAQHVPVDMSQHMPWETDPHRSLTVSLMPYQQSQEQARFMRDNPGAVSTLPEGGVSTEALLSEVLAGTPIFADSNTTHSSSSAPPAVEPPAFCSNATRDAPATSTADVQSLQAASAEAQEGPDSSSEASSAANGVGVAPSPGPTTETSLTSAAPTPVRSSSAGHILAPGAAQPGPPGQISSPLGYAPVGGGSPASGDLAGGSLSGPSGRPGLTAAAASTHAGLDAASSPQVEHLSHPEPSAALSIACRPVMLGDDSSAGPKWNPLADDRPSLSAGQCQTSPDICTILRMRLCCAACAF